MFDSLRERILTPIRQLGKGGRITEESLQAGDLFRRLEGCGRQGHRLHVPDEPQGDGP